MGQDRNEEKKPQPAQNAGDGKRGPLPSRPFSIGKREAIVFTLELNIEVDKYEAVSPGEFQVNSKTRRGNASPE